MRRGAAAITGTETGPPRPLRSEDGCGRWSGTLRKSQTAWTQTFAWMLIFFFASAAASSAYLTASELFPLETRALAIAVFYAVGTAIGGTVAPALFGHLIETGSPWSLAAGYIFAARTKTTLMRLMLAVRLSSRSFLRTRCSRPLIRVFSEPEGGTKGICRTYRVAGRRRGGWPVQRTIMLKTSGSNRSARDSRTCDSSRCSRTQR